MSESRHYVAVDLGAESGRVMLATCSPNSLEIEELHRFPNGPIEQDGSLRWDFPELMSQIKTGLKKAFALGKTITSIGVDTWGVDFGLLDANGKLLENPYHYRDSRNNGMIEAAAKLLPRDQIYANTGIQFMIINSVFQLLATKQQRPELLDKTAHLLFIPNLVMYELCGEIQAEYTIASTSQMVDMNTSQWSETVLDALGLPRKILPPIVHPGTVAGQLKADLAKELGGMSVPIVSVGTHDTASAVAAVPVTHDKSWAYLSSGTWSLMGIESATPVINDTTYQLDYTNEGGVGQTIRVLKNIMGLWLVQECKRHWASEGDDLNYSQITHMASEAEPFTAVLNTDHADFMAPKQMPQKINQYLKTTGQAQITDKGQMVRVILESLAHKYTHTIQSLETLSGNPIDVLHMVGGGIQNELLNQLTADATGKRVVTGPIEATVIGNVLVQALAQGQIGSLAEGRALVATSFAGKEYDPGPAAPWQAFAKKAKDIIG
ncbi:MAG: rhamnulokinase [Planctomycetes bacterium]|nr:rhamnulokinase [Planctomycetota bacterium]